MKSLTDDTAAYCEVIDCKMAHNVWETLAKQYGQSSKVLLHVLKSQLSALFKKEDTSILDHVDQFSQLVEQINYHLESREKWSNGWINRTFFGTISSEQWGAYKDGLGNTIDTILPPELYGLIKAPEAAKKENARKESSIATLPSTLNKEANFTIKQ